MIKSSIVILTLFLTIQLNAQENPPSFIINQLDDYINEALSEWRVPGAAICIVKDGKVLINKGYGVKSVGTEDAVDKNTLFMLGSNSKAFTATAIAQLSSLRNFSLSDPVVKWLPSFKLSDQWLTKKITLQDLLSHQSGLSKYAGDFILFDTDFTKAELIEKVEYLPIREQFRSFNYTNVGYFLIGEVIEEISQTSYSEYMKNQIFMPFGMLRTGSTPSELLEQENHAKPHSILNDSVIIAALGNSDNMRAGGGIYSSVEDLSKWLLIQLDSGRIDGEQVLDLQIIYNVRTPKVLIGRTEMPYTMFNKSQFEHYSLGWYHMDYEGLELITHNGGAYGFSSSITLIPELNLGVAILTNSIDHLLFETLKLEIMDAFMGLPFRNYSALGLRFQQFLKAGKDRKFEEQRMRVKPLANPNQTLKKYVGEYKNDIYGYINLSISGESLIVNFEHHLKLKGELKFINDDEFLCTFNNEVYGEELLSFLIKGGEVQGLLLSVDNNVEPGSYAFQKTIK